MNWSKLKEKFPNSYCEIREYYHNTGLKGRMLINEFLKSKGYNITHTFIKKLKEYENQTQIIKTRHEKRNDRARTLFKKEKLRTGVPISND